MRTFFLKESIFLPEHNELILSAVHPSAGVMTLKLPHLKRRGSSSEPGMKERLWLHVHWPEGRATQLVSSSFGYPRLIGVGGWGRWSSGVALIASLCPLSGELVLWDLSRAGKQRWSLFGTSSEGQNHNRVVFNMSSVRVQDGRELLVSTSMDREVRPSEVVDRLPMAARVSPSPKQLPTFDFPD